MTHPTSTLVQKTAVQMGSFALIEIPLTMAADLAVERTENENAFFLRFIKYDVL